MYNSAFVKSLLPEEGTSLRRRGRRSSSLRDTLYFYSAFQVFRALGFCNWRHRRFHTRKPGREQGSNEQLRSTEIVPYLFRSADWAQPFVYEQKLFIATMCSC